MRASRQRVQHGAAPGWRPPAAPLALPSPRAAGTTTTVGKVQVMPATPHTTTQRAVRPRPRLSTVAERIAARPMPRPLRGLSDELDAQRTGAALVRAASVTETDTGAER